MTDKQPEALRLADAIDTHDYFLVDVQAAATELRRLHEAHDWQYRMAGERLRRVEKLEALNAELKVKCEAFDEVVEALREALPALEAAWYNESEAHKVRTALAKVEASK